MSHALRDAYSLTIADRAPRTSYTLSNRTHTRDTSASSSRTIPSSSSRTQSASTARPHRTSSVKSTAAGTRITPLTAASRAP
ncbi:hypothetical protein FA95DRAFT_1564257, partial [Auriscalpium vulgare]